MHVFVNNNKRFLILVEDGEGGGVAKDHNRTVRANQVKIYKTSIIIIPLKQWEH